MNDMEFNSDTLRALASELHQAQKTRQQIAQFSQRFPTMTIEDGYRISRAWVELQRQEGAKVIGHKIGLTSRAMRKAANVFEPDYGTLMDYMLHVLPTGQQTRLPLDTFIEPRVEVELAFVLKRELKGKAFTGRDTTIEEVLEATDHILPSIEIIDARIQRVDAATGKTRTVIDSISDNAANAAILVGDKPFDPRSLDLPWCPCVLWQNGVVEETGVAAGVQGHPAIGIAWLADKLSAFGETLEPGQLVLAGSFTRLVPIERGDHFVADFGPLGRLDFSFE
jgi:2-oxo-hept-3-ene-1,7-dioate hydratase